MLVLSRERNESIVVGDNIKITVVDIRGEKVRIGVEAPRELPIHRQEVYDRLRRLNRAAAAEVPAGTPGVAANHPTPASEGGSRA